MNIIIKRMETDEEIRGKAFVTGKPGMSLILGSSVKNTSTI